ncbi:MAG: phosphate regulon sensor histidine kinase PhoR [Porticoccaceae bacterium]|nr:phosphate regulon sensor histidine kinase PhoR [Porticoccaceae bacterium]
MRQGMQNEIWRIIAIALFSLIFGISLERPLEALLFGSLLYILWASRTIGRLFKWIDIGMRGVPPDMDGVWGELADTFNRQRRRHRGTQEKMRRAINRAKRVTEAVDDAVIVLRQDRTIDWWNSAGKKLLGLRSSDRGVAITNLIRDPKFVNYINGNHFESTSLPTSIHNGRLLEFSAVMFAENEIVVVISDVTHINDLEKVRKEFIGNISHELRTPLTVMRGYIDTLSDIEGNSAIATKAYQEMSNQVDRMKDLSDDIILLSKFESDGAAAVEQINLNELLAVIVGEAEQLSAGKHSISLNCAESVVLNGENKMLRSALGNIVFNAVLHNPQGAEIAIEVTQTKSNTVVVIDDNGVGIDSDEIPRLTERFYRGDSSRNSNTGGSGLGLAIVKHALTRSGAVLDIKSSLGNGAKFTCTFSGQ